MHCWRAEEKTHSLFLCSNLLGRRKRRTEYVQSSSEYNLSANGIRSSRHSHYLSAPNQDFLRPKTCTRPLTLPHRHLHRPYHRTSYRLDLEWAARSDMGDLLAGYGTTGGDSYGCACFLPLLLRGAQQSTSSQQNVSSGRSATFLQRINFT